MAIKRIKDWATAVQPYRQVLDDFVGGRLDAMSFVAAYGAIHLASTRFHDMDIFDALDRLFVETEFYEEDPVERARQPIRIDEAIMLRSAQALLDRADAARRSDAVQLREASRRFRWPRR